MFRIIIIMLSGMALGFAFHRHRLPRIQAVITVLIWALLYLLGVEVGRDETIIRAMPTLGVEALGITAAALSGSMLCAWGLWAWLYKGRKKEDAAHAAAEGDSIGTVNAATNCPIREEEKESNPLKGSLIIVSFFIAGVVSGYTGIVSFDPALTNFSYITLCCLMLSVGFSIGNDPQTIRNFKALNPRLALLPLLTIIGTLSACALWSVFATGRSLTDYLAVGSGFGYYSLSSIFITEYKGAELGTVALLGNIFREIITLTCAPLMVRWFGRLAPISAGGATTMDTTLPIITRCSGRQFVVLSIYHGFIVDFSVPFLVTFFCSI